MDDKEFEQKEYERRKRIKQKKYIKNCFLVLFVFCIFLSFFYMFRNDNVNDVIEKYCGSGKYKKMYNLAQVTSNYTCSNLISYLEDNKDLDTSEILYLINNKNKDIYIDFYNYTNKELLDYVKFDEEFGKEFGEFFSVEYFTYLYEEKDYVPSIDIYNYTLDYYFENEYYDDWKLLVSYLEKYNFKWDNAYKYFDSGYAYDATYDEREEIIKSLTSYSKYYHQISKDYECFRADLYDINMLKEIYENNKENKNACTYVMYKYADEVNSTAIDNYIKSGGSLSYQYGEDTFLHVVAKNSRTDSEEEYKEFSKKIEIFTKAGLSINSKVVSDSDYDNGNTVLDSYIYDHCYHQTSYNMREYRLLKSYGAKCNKKCTCEKDFIEGNEYEY